MNVVALSGGTGSAKLLRGLKRIGVDLTVVANVGDNFWAYGAYVCPDVDVASYTLAGISDEERGWGIAGDTFNALEGFSRLGAETWFRLGDRDLATCLYRTELMRLGSTLTEATGAVCRAIGVEARVLPATDQRVETRVLTPQGDLHLQEFWVREGGSPKVDAVRFLGSKKARPSEEVASAVAKADRIVVCPANPITSIGPMLATSGFRRLLERSKARVVALSPMAGDRPFSGPAGKLMQAKGLQTSSVGVARLYRSFLDAMVISESDSALVPQIEKMGIDCSPADTRMRGPADEFRLAEGMMNA